jgi:hypothetical protein
VHFTDLVPDLYLNLLFIQHIILLGLFVDTI